MLKGSGIPHQDCFERQELVARAIENRNRLKVGADINTATTTNASPAGDTSSMGTNRMVRKIDVDLACSLAENGNFEQALDHFERALVLDQEEVCIISLCGPLLVPCGGRAHDNGCASSFS